MNYEHTKALAFHSLVTLHNKIEKVIEKTGETDATRESSHHLQMLVNFFTLKTEHDQQTSEKQSTIKKPLYINKELFRHNHNSKIKNEYL